MGKRNEDRTMNISATKSTMKKMDRRANMAEPDLVDRIFDYLRKSPELKDRLDRMELDAGGLERLQECVRFEFGGETAYIRRRPVGERQKMAKEVLSLFNGRNATEIARELEISRATVYRCLKQSGSGS